MYVYIYINRRCEQTSFGFMAYKSRPVEIGCLRYSEKNSALIGHQIDA